MSTSHLYHAYGISGVQYKSTDHREGEVIFKTEIDRKSVQCLRCKSKNFHFKGKDIASGIIIALKRRSGWAEIIVRA